MSRLIRDDIDKFFNYGIEVLSKTLYMGEREGTDFHMAEKVIKGLHILDKESHTKMITIIMNNQGGDEYNGLAIYDAVRMCRSKTRIKVLGHAMSMGSWILQTADERHMSENSTMMLHYGSLGYEGHAKDFDMQSNENKRLCTLMEDCFLERIREKHPRYTRESLQELIRYDRFLTAEEVVKLGLADKVI